MSISSKPPSADRPYFDEAIQTLPLEKIRQLQNERLVIDRSEINELQQGTLSLMPDGLLEALKEDEIRDLIAYLMHPQQVPLQEKTEY